MQKKIVLITGYSSELAQAITARLPESAYIIYAGVRMLQKAATPSNHVYQIKLDVSDDQSCKRVVGFIIKKHRRVDVLINLAGYSVAGATGKFETSDYLAILNTNSAGAFRLIKLVLPHMQKHLFGRIINVTSLSGLVALPNFGIYSSSKFALEALGKSLRYEVAKYNVWVTNVAPGAIASSKTNHSPMPHKPFRQKFKLAALVLPMITPNSIAEKIANLLEQSHPPASLLLGNDTIIASLLQRFLPASIWDRLLLYIWSKK